MAKAPLQALPKDLVEQAARGHCVALIGPSTDLDAQRASFVETLARECAYPPDKRDRSLPAVAYYYQGMRDRQQLIARLRDWTDQVEQSPAPLLSGLAASPFTRFVDFAHDARLQFALLSEETETSRWEAEGVTPLIAPDPVQWLATRQQEVAALPPAPQDLIPVDGPLLGRRPYKFLDYYTAQDADLFFGRQAWIEQVTARILAQPLTVLFGPLGVGKTSLLQAGLMPRLRSQGYLPIYSRPEADPVTAVWQAVGSQHATPDRQGGQPDNGAVRAGSARSAHGGRPAGSARGGLHPAGRGDHRQPGRGAGRRTSPGAGRHSGGRLCRRGPGAGRVAE